MVCDDVSLRWAIRDVVSTSLAVAGVALLVVLAAGVWPPFVAIESGSMTPGLQEGDLVVLVEEHRLSGDAAVADTGVVTAARAHASGYERIAGPGDVILFFPNGDRNATPVIHRAAFYVEAGENWYGEADPRYVGTAQNCDQLRHCPAPNDGFITHGDANGRYDQATWKYRPVKPEWVAGRAAVRIPYLGWIRLLVDEALAASALHPVGRVTTGP